MEKLTYRVAQREDYQALADWLVQLSQAPERHCLHTWSGESAGDLHRQLLSTRDDGEMCYLLALEDGQLVGAMGSEFDVELERGWLHGPHMAAEDREAIADELFSRLLAELPASIRQLSAYLNVENQRGRRFYRQRGYEEKQSLNYDFWLLPGDRVLSGDRGCVLLGKEHETSFKQLYEVLFPMAYYSAERVIHMIGHSHQVLVIAEKEQVLGFAVTSAEAGQSAGEIQFVGVREECRRQGNGRRLLLSAVDWLLDGAEVSRVCLNVGEERVYARRLYESVGFKLRFTGIGLSRTDE